MYKFDKVMMETALIWAKQSYCKRRQVGAVLAKDDRILATGFNGTLTGTKNKCENEYYECPNCLKTSNDINQLFSLKVEKSEPCHLKNIYSAKCFYCGGIVHKKEVKTSEDPNEQLFSTIGRNKFDWIEPKMVTNDFTVHAEQNVITFCAKNGISTEETTLYVTTSPCKQCAKLIASSGIIRVVYYDKYKDTSGIDFLNEINISCEQYIEE